MTHQQLTLLNIPTHTPTSQWELENQDACNHNWKPSLDDYGIVCFRCWHCNEKKPVDPVKDRDMIRKSAESLKRVYRDYYNRYLTSKTKKDKNRFLNAARDRYWRGRIEFLMIGIDEPLESEQWEKDHPCPQSLQTHYEILTQKPPLNDLGKKSDEEKFDTSESFARGLETPSNITPSNITPSTKTRRKKGEGSGTIFSKMAERESGSYEQWWFQYEETGNDGKRKKRTVYLSKTELKIARRLNLLKTPVSQILEALGKSNAPKHG